MMLKSKTDFREYLRRELESRLAKNSRYSLRAFAGQLKIDSSRLSKILKGQRPVSHKIIETLGERMKLSPQQINKFKTGTRKPYKKETPVAADSEELYQLKLDQLALISEWQHYAILELMKHPQFEPTAKWISEQLNQPRGVIEMAIDRLKRIGLVRIEGEVWRDASEGFSTHVMGDNITSRAHRNYQLQILDLSREALFSTPIEFRDHSTIAVASSPDKIQAAKKMIRQFRRELAEFLEECPAKTEIFHLNIGLFPVPKKRDSQSEEDRA